MQYQGVAALFFQKAFWRKDILSGFGNWDDLNSFLQAASAAFPRGTLWEKGVELVENFRQKERRRSGGFVNHAAGAFLLYMQNQKVRQPREETEHGAGTVFSRIVHLPAKRGLYSPAGRGWTAPCGMERFSAVRDQP